MLGVCHKISFYKKKNIKLINISHKAVGSDTNNVHNHHHRLNSVAANKNLKHEAAKCNDVLPFCAFIHRRKRECLFGLVGLFSKTIAEQKQGMKGAAKKEKIPCNPAI